MPSNNDAHTLGAMIRRLSPRSMRGRRQGGLPRFNSEEVAIIRADKRPNVHIARAWGVCYDTIARVKGAGRYAGLNYIPRDEVLAGSVELMNQFPLPRGGKAGRKKQIDPIDAALKEEIGYDLRSAKKVALRYGLTPNKVYRIRQEVGIDQIKRRIYRATMQAIAASTSTPEQLAKSYRLPLETVLRIRDNYLTR